MPEHAFHQSDPGQEKYIGRQSRSERFTESFPAPDRRLVWQPDGFQSVIPPHAQQEPEHRRMQVHVVVRIHMIKNQSRLVKCFELSPYFGLQLFPDSGAEEKFEAGTHQIS